ncbi:multiple sugar transport system permease protein/sn-glycerol 3-phosphate transport system permease protein [Oikeobacillus pervagus]|uniref:Multiple sugar transport system permease protein/sn-glycerol 3-phosphate transport system permease protein n=2 Tax=Oikeobacillus pervagus TaxID=1325931 RepID=A0AAJ1WGM9_9BACI|nr:multiple sugar transport system permease protein/sn-glycerol 3-phosphate transport system permease protein [Oikeobacillus pervagus]
MKTAANSSTNMNLSYEWTIWDRTANFRTAFIYLLPSIILFSTFVFYPMFKTIYLSFFLTDQQGNEALFVGLDNYINLLQSETFLKSIKATILFVLYTVPTTIFISLFLALLANEKLKGVGFFRTIYSSTMSISVAASSVVWLFLFHPSVGVFNRILSVFGIKEIQWLLDPEWALLSVSISTIWLNLGFSFLILLGGLQNIDEHLYESAKLDGASYFYQLRRITIPMLSPTLFFIITISLINAFQTFGQIDILTRGGPSEATNLIVYSIYQDAFIHYQFGTASAQSVILFIFIFIATIFQFKLGEKKVHYQ